MLITLKQREIEAALRQYVATNGINLAGKTVDIAFTAGRKESGLSAEVSIEDDGSKALDLPVHAAAPVLVEAVVADGGTTQPTLDPVVADPAPAEGAVPVTDTGATVTSLFG